MLNLMLPAEISDPVVKHTANEYRKIMKFYDAQVYWLGTTTDQKMAMKISFSKKKLTLNLLRIIQIMLTIPWKI